MKLEWKGSFFATSRTTFIIGEIVKGLSRCNKVCMQNSFNRTEDPALEPFHYCALFKHDSIPKRLLVTPSTLRRERPRKSQDSKSIEKFSQMSRMDQKFTLLPHFRNFYCVVDMMLYKFILNVFAELATYALVHPVCVFSYTLLFRLHNRCKMR